MQKILAIEDETRLQKMLEEIFKQGGFELFSANDGVSGLKLAEEKMPDIILLDLILPKKNGFDVLKELKANPRLAKIPVVVLTNLEGAQDIEKALSLGAYTYLVKANYSLDDILKKVKEVLVQNET
ncbi:response regulator [Patescibacteria group bacterium]|nr:response regulator [Patescibacteria group bacterium]MBU2219224.1 response regulator [Patescibacteria group bacterium]MBU2263448.1 response regulator [Patescibacteria group bacterium]